MGLETTLKKMALYSKNKTKTYNIVRGHNSKGAHYRGLLELQHPWHVSVPWSSSVIAHLCNQPAMALSGSQERVLRAIVGHTWMYRKTSEIISWSHFINGKSDSRDGSQLVASAGISRGSLKAALDGLAESMAINRAELHLGGKTVVLYSPNSLCFGADPSETARELVGEELPNCTYGKFAEDIYPLLIPALPSMLATPTTPKTLLYREILCYLRAPELLALFLESHYEELDEVLKPRYQARIAIHESLEKAKAIAKTFAQELQEQEDMLSIPELEWVGSAKIQLALKSVQATSAEISAVRLKAMDGPINPYIAKATIHKYGIPLLTLDPLLWKRVTEQVGDFPEYLSNQVLVAKSILKDSH